MGCLLWACGLDSSMGQHGIQMPHLTFSALSNQALPGSAFWYIQDMDISRPYWSEKELNNHFSDLKHERHDFIYWQTRPICHHVMNKCHQKTLHKPNFLHCSFAVKVYLEGNYFSQTQRMQWYLDETELTPLEPSFYLEYWPITEHDFILWEYGLR